MNILIVDDSPSTCMVLTSVLEAGSDTVTAYATGEEAVAGYLTTQPSDLIRLWRRTNDAHPWAGMVRRLRGAKKNHRKSPNSGTVAGNIRHEHEGIRRPNLNYRRRTVFDCCAEIDLW